MNVYAFPFFLPWFLPFCVGILRTRLSSGTNAPIGAAQILGEGNYEVFFALLNLAGLMLTPQTEFLNCR